MKKENSKDSINNDIYKILDKYCQIQLQAWKDIADFQLKFNQQCIDACMKQIPTANNAKNLFSVDSDIAAEYSRSFTESTQQLMEKLMNAECELLDCLTKSGEIYKDIPLFMLPTNKEGGRAVKQQEARNRQE